MKIDFTPVSDERLIAWYRAITDNSVQTAGEDELQQVKNEIFNRGLDLSNLL